MATLGYKVMVLAMVFAIVKTTEVSISKAWKMNHGWEITCSWKLFSNDSLQSVRLFISERQFMIYRPEKDGYNYQKHFKRPGDTLMADCSETDNKGILGKCVITMDMYQPQKEDFQFNCEVSGERPKFIRANKTILVEALVPPTRAVVVKESENLESGRVMLNCTSSGLPAPSLMWGIGDQKIPHDFTGSSWNATSKLWDVWSLLSYSPSSDYLAFCRPEVSKGGLLIKSHPTFYNSAYSIRDLRKTLVYVSIIISLRLW